MKSLLERQIGTRIAKMLQYAQHSQGYISDMEIQRIANHVGEPVRVIQDVVSFFPHYRRKPLPHCTVSVCRDMACRLRGSAEATNKLKALQSQHEDKLIVHEASCLGRCDRAPAMIVEQGQEQQLFVSRNSDEIVRIVRDLLSGKSLTGDSDVSTARETLERSQIDCYRNLSNIPPYEAVRRFTSSPDSSSVIAALRNAHLLGMGGAGAPAANKWEEAMNARGEAKYVICNADESEPGTFKDRDLLMAAPHLVIEGMIMAALVIGAQRGFIYVRHEYFEQIEWLEAEIENATSLKALGNNIFESEYSFQLEVFVSPGGYVCGEQTALVEALEGKRSEPRNRPPELQTNGLYDQPTVLNNVETFAWVPAILLRIPDAEANALVKNVSGKNDSNSVESTASISSFKAGGQWYKGSGKKPFKGKRFFSVSGDIARPGVYEVPNGLLLGELIDDYALGMRDNEKLFAVALSGPSGGFMPAELPDKSIRYPKKLDAQLQETNEPKYAGISGGPTDIRLLPLDVDASRDIGFMLGAGIVVYGSSADLLDQMLACTRFYQRESCGKCVPCRLGARKMVDLAEQLRSGAVIDARSLMANANLLARIMRTTSICGLGQVASEPLRTYLAYFHTKS